MHSSYPNLAPARDSYIDAYKRVGFQLIRTRWQIIRNAPLFRFINWKRVPSFLDWLVCFEIILAIWIYLLKDRCPKQNIAQWINGYVQNKLIVWKKGAHVQERIIIKKCAEKSSYKLCSYIVYYLAPLWKYSKNLTIE